MRTFPASILIGAALLGGASGSVMAGITPQAMPRSHPPRPAPHAAGPRAYLDTPAPLTKRQRRRLRGKGRS